MHKPFKQTCKTPIISKVQTCLPGSEKSESSSAKFAAPSPLPEPTAITKTGTNVKTNTCTETFPKNFQINLIKTRQNLKIVRKRITQKFLFIKKL